MYLPPKIDQEFWTELKGESKQSKMIVDRIMVLDKDANVHEALKEEFFKDFKAEFAEDFKAEFTEKIKAEVAEDFKAEFTEKIKAEVAEEIKAEVLEERKTSIRKLILSTSMHPTEIADIMGASIEEVLKIKAEIDTQN